MTCFLLSARRNTNAAAVKAFQMASCRAAADLPRRAASIESSQIVQPSSISTRCRSKPGETRMATCSSSSSRAHMGGRQRRSHVDVDVTGRVSGGVGKLASASRRTTPACSGHILASAAAYGSEPSWRRPSSFNAVGSVCAGVDPRPRGRHSCAPPRNERMRSSSASSCSRNSRSRGRDATKPSSTDNSPSARATLAQPITRSTQSSGRA